MQDTQSLGTKQALFFACISVFEWLRSIAKINTLCSAKDNEVTDIGINELLRTSIGILLEDHYPKSPDKGSGDYVSRKCFFRLRASQEISFLMKFILSERGDNQKTIWTLSQRIYL